MHNPYIIELGETPGKKCSTCVRFTISPGIKKTAICAVAGGEVSTRMDACGEWRGVLEGLRSSAKTNPAPALGKSDAGELRLF